jgi:hypothetical protein
MAWLAVNRHGREYIYQEKPKKLASTGAIVMPSDDWHSYGSCVELPQGFISAITGHRLTWDSQPLELSIERGEVVNRI